MRKTMTNEKCEGYAVNLFVLSLVALSRFSNYSSCRSLT